MSALFGIIHWDDAVPEPPLLQRFGKMLEHRGDRPVQIWSRGGAGLGHCLLVDTPEAAGEILPGEHPEAKVVITADARIDNRAELIRALVPGASDPATIADSALILLAYLQWGDECVQHLLGDFSFAIWDPRNHRLFCGRDHFGIKPFYYLAQGNRFAFASEIAPLLSLPGVSRAVDRGTIAEFMAGMREDGPRTFHAEISKLPPGHILKASPSGLCSWQYYRLAAQPGIDLDQPEERFLAAFETAVARRMRGVRDVPCMLSGGLDSSAITCMANRLSAQSSDRPIRTISRTYPSEVDCDEAEYIGAVVRAGRYQSHYHPAPSEWSFEGLVSMTEMLAEPTNALGMFGNGLLYPVVRALGCNVVLDGHGGDEVLSQPAPFLRELASGDRWIQLAREWMPLARDYKVPVLKTYLQLAGSYGKLGRLKGGVAKWRRSTTPTALTANAGNTWAMHIDRRLVAETNLLAKRVDWRRGQSDWTNDSQAAHLRMLVNTGQSVAFDSLNQASLRSGVEPRYPFWDKDLVELCLALPPTLKMRNGWTRFVLRRSLRGILPDKIRWRRSKTAFSSPCAKALRQVGERNLRPLIDRQNDIAAIVSPEWYHSALDELFPGSSSALANLPTLWRSISLLAWLPTGDGKRAAEQISQSSNLNKSRQGVKLYETKETVP